MPIGTILSVVAAYIAIAILLLSMNLTSRWRWWIKAAAIVITGCFFAGSYFAIVSLLGWPTREEPPTKFSLIATRIVEPDKVTGAPGIIYLWLETLDENNVPSGLPRSYSIAYASDLAATVTKAQDMIDGGDDVQGSLEPTPSAKQDAAPGTAPGGDSHGGTSYDPTGQNLVFNDMPAVKLPDKGVL